MVALSVVWDFNGTLLDDVQACLDALNAILREHHLPVLTVEEYRARFRFPVPQFYQELGLKPSSAFEWEAIAESFHIRYLFSHHLKLQPGAREAVASLTQAGIRQGVLSALEQDLLVFQLHQLHLAPAMAFIRGSDNYQGASKERAAQSLRLEQPVVLVGDTLHDAEVARAQGWHCILCSAGHQTPERLRQSGFPVIPTLADLPARLREDFPNALV